MNPGYQSIILIQGGYDADSEEFVLERHSPESDWTVKHRISRIIPFLTEKGREDITSKFGPRWLARTVEELRILELKSQDEIGFESHIIDGTGFSITIENEGRRKDIYYHHYFDQVGDYSDVWRADTLWTLLKHTGESAPVMEG